MECIDDSMRGCGADEGLAVPGRRGILPRLFRTGIHLRERQRRGFIPAWGIAPGTGINHDSSPERATHPPTHDSPLQGSRSFPFKPMAVPWAGIIRAFGPEP